MNYLISTRLTITIVWMTLVSLKVGFSYPSKRDSNDSGNGQIICQRPLGLSHNINSTLVQSTLSATQGNGNDARLHGPKSWIASRMDDNTYLQVNFSEPIIATGILIQGDPELSEWVSSFTVSYSMGCERFSPVIDNGSTQVFAGNLDPNSVAVVEFNNVYVAQCIRIIPTERHGNKSAMRVELLGCVDRTCTNTLATNWNVNRVQNMMELRFPSEKIVSDIAILPREEVWSNNRYTISYSRSCTNYRDVKENGNTQTYVSTDGGPILIDFGTQPLRVLCLRISALDSDFQDSIDIQIQLSGCGLTEQDAPLESCGHTRHKNRSRRQKRVIGGNHAAPGQWPWLVSMHFLPYHDFSNKSGYQHLCGATLIHPQWVLSAAHCYDENVGHNLSNNENWRAYVGEHNLNGREGTEQVFRIAKIIKHDNFQIAANSPILQDLALLKLDRPVVLSDYVNTICLAANNSFPPGTPCVAAGWGQNSLTGAGVKLPLHVELPILHSTECNRRYNSLPDDHEVKNHVSIVDSVLCAASENGNKDSCFGDSGGPLVCRTGDYWTQVGVVSFGYGCGDTNFPGVYTKVSYYINWITSKIQAETASVSNWNSWMHQSHSSSRDNILKP